MINPIKIKAAKIAKHAHENNLSLRQSALDLKLVTAEQFDELVRPQDMIAPKQPAAE